LEKEDSHKVAEDKIVVRELMEDGMPKEEAKARMRRLVGLIAR
jgi:hypothetical protein